MTQPTLPLGQQPAAPSHWGGKLSELLEVLTRECQAGEDGCWAFRLLRGAALVAVQIDSADRDRRLVRIARREAPESEHAKKAWEHEVETFVRHLGVGSWSRLPDASGPGVSVRFRELWPGETAPGKAACSRCQKEIAFQFQWGKTQLCEICARLAGDEDTRAMQEARCPRQ